MNNKFKIPSTKYCRASVTKPAVTGVAIDVPKKRGIERGKKKRSQLLSINCKESLNLKLRNAKEKKKEEESLVIIPAILTIWHVGVAVAAEFAEKMKYPGAETSGFKRPSDVGALQREKESVSKKWSFWYPQ